MNKNKPLIHDAL